MEQRRISSQVLITETVYHLLRFSVFVGALAATCLVLFWVGLISEVSELTVVVVASLFTLALFSAAFASSAIRYRRGIRLRSRAGADTLLFAFLWGALVGALFVVSLQIWQGMAATVTNYAVAMAAAGILSSATAALPSGR